MTAQIILKSLIWTLLLTLAGAVVERLTMHHWPGLDFFISLAVVTFVGDLFLERRAQMHKTAPSQLKE